MFDSTIGRGVDLFFKLAVWIAIFCVPMAAWKGVDLVVWFITNVVDGDV